MARLPGNKLEHSAGAEPGVVIDEEAEPLPVLIANSGNAAQFAWEEFIYGRLANHQTRRVYRRAIERFFEWCHGARSPSVTICEGLSWTTSTLLEYPAMTQPHRFFEPPSDVPDD